MARYPHRAARLLVIEYLGSGVADARLAYLALTHARADRTKAEDHQQPCTWLWNSAGPRDEVERPTSKRSLVTARIVRNGECPCACGARASKCGERILRLEATLWNSAKAASL